MTPLMVWGLRRLLGGVQGGRSATAGLGAAALLLGYMRSHREPARERIFATNLREGEGLRIRFLSEDQVVGETEIQG